MSFTTADLSTIESAIKKGTLTVRFSDGDMVTYRNMEELIQAHKFISSQVDRKSRGGIRIRGVTPIG